MKQRTLKNSIRATGVGLHTGEKVYMTLRPASVNSGIVFRRVDLEIPVDIVAKAENVGETMLGTTIVNGDVKVCTVEHLLSAFAGLGIDNAEVDWGRAHIALSISDARPIKNAPEVDLNGTRTRFESGGVQIVGLAPQITAAIGGYLETYKGVEELQFSIDLDISGTDRLQFMPFGDKTRVSMQSPWPSPSSMR